jgi:hypothetical protein
MIYSKQILNERVGRGGLTQLSVNELFQSHSILIEILTEKVNGLDSNNLTERELEKEIRALIDLLRETLSRRYNGLSILAFAEILVGLDHFIRVNDAVPDTKIGGYQDDLAAIRKVSSEFREEFDRFIAWKKQMMPSQ